MSIEEMEAHPLVRVSSTGSWLEASEEDDQ